MRDDTCIDCAKITSGDCGKHDNTMLHEWDARKLAGEVPFDTEQGWRERFQDFYNLFRENVVDHRYGEFESFIASELIRAKRETIEEYTDFLLKYNYVDSDVYAEKPTAIERFLATRLRGGK